MTEKPAKPAQTTTKPTEAREPAASPKPSHDQIAERAYAIHLEEGGSDEENWLRAERELTPA
jgi:hypothetical protein